MLLRRTRGRNGPGLVLHRNRTEGCRACLSSVRDDELERLYIVWNCGVARFVVVGTVDALVASSADA